MSADGRIDRDFGDGTYSFRIAIGQWPELQEKCKAGPYYILNRLLDGSWLVEYITNVVRLGLIGGGTPPAAALTLTRTYVEERPLMENLFLAIEVLQAALMGAPDEPLGETGAADQTGEKSTISLTDAFDLPPSTEPVPPAASLRKKSTK